jgi:inner membrane transporter RhtA
VAALTEPWHGGGSDPVGVLLALGAAACWAAYILLTQRAGDEVDGLQALAVSLPVAAAATSVLVGPGVIGRLDWQLVLVGAGLALLMPVIPFSLELLALRRLKASVFGTLMSVEPAIAVVIGFVVLGQAPGLTALLGVALVVAAGVGVTLQSGREREPVRVGQDDGGPLAEMPAARS